MVGSGEKVIAVKTIRLDREGDDPAVQVVVRRRIEDDESTETGGHDVDNDVDDEVAGEDEGMATNEERIMILRMVEQGKINAEEGARLLAALGNRAQGASGGRAPGGRAPNLGSGRSGRVFRVRVSDNLTGRQKVNVDIPLALAEFGLRFVPKSAGVDVESIRQALDSGIEGRVLDVTDHEDGHRVEIFIE